MNDEIQNILEDLSLFVENDNMPYEIKGEDCKLLLDYITNLQENEDLREENKETHDFDETMKDIKDNLIARINRQDKEIERLNNIINELEKWILEEHKKKQKWYNEQLSINDKRYYEEKYLTSLIMINVFFDKLQELKGDSSNE